MKEARDCVLAKDGREDAEDDPYKESTDAHGDERRAHDQIDVPVLIVHLLHLNLNKDKAGPSIINLISG